MKISLIATVTIIAFCFLLNSKAIAQQDTQTFLDNNGKAVSENQAFYYRIVTKAPDTYKIFYHSNNQKYFEGRIISISEYNENENRYAGTCIWYYKNGKIKAERHFDEKGLEEGTSRYYYESGKPQREYQFINGILKNNAYVETDENGSVTEIFEDTFSSNNSDWDLYSGIESKSAIEKGSLVITPLTKAGSSRYINLPISRNSYSIEAIFKPQSEGKARYGLIWGFKDWDNYNFLMISSNYVTIGAIFEGMRVEVANDLYCSAVSFISNNIFKILVDNGSLFISINGEFLRKTSELKMPGSNIGFVTSGLNVLSVENLVVKQFAGRNPSLKAGTDITVRSSGTGLILNSDGYIVTNYHVAGDATYVFADVIQDQQTRTYEAKVIVNDEANDLCILKIEPDNNFPDTVFFSLASSASVVPGTSVFTLGYPLALSGMGFEPKFTDGKISSRTGYNNAVNAFQTTIPVQPGNSGSPVFNENGELGGIISAKVMDADNVSYAIKLNYLQSLVELIPGFSLPSSSIPAKLSFTEKIALLSKYVVLIKIK